jgi:hypothetical protein
MTLVIGTAFGTIISADLTVLDTYDKFVIAYNAAGPARMKFAMDARYHFNTGSGIATDAIGGLTSTAVGAGMVRVGKTIRSANSGSSTLRWNDVGAAGTSGEWIICICSADDSSSVARGFSLGQTENSRLDFTGGASNTTEVDLTTSRPRLLIGGVGGALGGEGDAYFAPQAILGRSNITDVKVDAPGSPVRTFVGGVSPDLYSYFGRCGAEKTFTSVGLSVQYYDQSATRTLELAKGNIRLGFFALVTGEPSAAQLGLADKFAVDSFGQTPSPAAGGLHVVGWGNSIFESYWAGIKTLNGVDTSDAGGAPALGTVDADGIVERTCIRFTALTGRPARSVNLGKSGYSWYWTSTNTVETHDRVNNPDAQVKHAATLWGLRYSVYLRHDAEAMKTVFLCYEDINSFFYWGSDASFNPPGPASVTRQIVDDSNFVLQWLRNRIGGTNNDAADIAIISCGRRGTTDQNVDELKQCRVNDQNAGTQPWDLLITDWADNQTLNSNQYFHSPEGAGIHYNKIGSDFAADLVAARLVEAYG